jgi:hypothetical protein
MGGPIMSLAKATFGTAAIPEEWISTITPVSDTIIKPEGGGDRERIKGSKRTGGPAIKVI